MLSDLKMALKRNGSTANYLNNYARANFAPMWKFLDRFDSLSDSYLILLLKENRKRIPRIPLMSAKVDYPTLETLYDESRTTYTRLLPRKKNYVSRLPPVEEVADLFKRNGNIFSKSNSHKTTGSNRISVTD